MDDDHMEIWLWEDTSESHWERWASRVERLIGHDLDGHQARDGYSMDETYDMYIAGLTPVEAYARIESSKRDKACEPR